MLRMLRSCLQSLLKLVNSILGMVGIAILLYSLWMIRIWLKQIDEESPPIPWFIYTILGLGIFLCVITCSGHIAAETVNGHCLSCYMIFAFLFVILEAAVTADVFLNHNWEEDFPEDPSGRLDELKNFVRSNVDLCKWIGSLIVAAQAISIFLAIILRALGPEQGSYYDSDDDYAPTRLPLLKTHVQQLPYPVDPHFTLKNDAWNANR